MNTLKLILFSVTATLLFTACLNSNSSNKIHQDQTGILLWGGPPAADGAGILFETENEIYGAPGNRDDYSEYFPKDSSKVQIIADIMVTGDTTIRGWGTKFPEIEFIRMERVQ